MLIFAIIALLASLVTSAATIYALFRILSAFRNAQAEVFQTVQQSLTAFVTPPSPDAPSPLAILADQLAIVFAGRIMQQLRAAAAGIASGQSRDELADGAAQIAGASPMASILMGLLPKKYRNQLIRNPQMVAQLGLFGGNNTGNHDDHAGSVQNRLRNGG